MRDQPYYKQHLLSEGVAGNVPQIRDIFPEESAADLKFASNVLRAKGGDLENRLAGGNEGTAVRMNVFEEEERKGQFGYDDKGRGLAKYNVHLMNDYQFDIARQIEDLNTMVGCDNQGRNADLKLRGPCAAMNFENHFNFATA